MFPLVAKDQWELLLFACKFSTEFNQHFLNYKTHLLAKEL